MVLGCHFTGIVIVHLVPSCLQLLPCDFSWWRKYATLVRCMATSVNTKEIYFHKFIAICPKIAEKALQGWQFSITVLTVNINSLDRWQAQQFNWLVTPTQYLLRVL